MNFRGQSPFILAASIAALFSVSFALDTARGALVVDSVTFDENAANSYSGGTFVRSTSSTGTLNLNVANALPNGTRSDITMDDGTSKGGSVINLNGFDQVASSLTSTLGKASFFNLNGYNLTVGNGGAATTTFYGSFASTGGLIKDGSSTQVLAGNTSLLYTTITGGDLEIGTVATAGTFSSQTAVSVSGGGTFTLVKMSSGTFNTDVTNGFGGIGTLNVNSATTTTIVGRLSDGSAGQLALTQSGTGKTILTNSNSYTGGTTVTGGELQIGTSTIASSIGVGSPVDISNGGKVTLVNAFTEVGSVVTLNLFTNNVTNSGAGVGTLSINSTKINTLSGDISDGIGQVALTQDGTGTTILSGFNTYSGATTVNHGTLQIGDGSALTGLLLSDVTVNAGTNFLVNNAILLGNVNLTVSTVSLKGIATAGQTNDLTGVISGTGSVQQNGTGTTILSGASTYTGATTVNAGTLQIGDDFTSGTSIATSGKVKVNGNGTLAIDLADTDTFVNAVSLNSTDTSVNTIASGTNTLSGVISGSGALNQTGSGTTILTAKETYNGTTTVSNGILQIGSITTAGSIVNHPVEVTAGGTLSLVNVIGNKFVNSVSNSSLGVSLGTLDVNSANTNTITGAVSDGVYGGLLALSQSGTGTTILTGTNKSYTGGTTVSGGFLQIGTASAVGSIGAGAVTVTTGGAIVVVNITGNAFSDDVTNGVGGVGTLTFNSTKTNTFYGQLTDGVAGQMALTQSGTGTTIVANGFNNYSGATTVSKGTLQVGTTGTAGSIGATSTTRISNGATMNVVNLSGTLNDVTNGVGGVGTLLFTAANTSTVTGVLSDGALGTLAVTQSGTGTTVLVNAGNTYSGATKVTKGTLRIGTSLAAGSIGTTSAVSVSNGGQLMLGNVNGSTFTNNVSNGVGGAGKLTINSPNTTTVSGLLANGATGTLALAQTGAGTGILTHANTYTGGTTVSAGTLLLSNLSGSGTGTGSVTVGGTGTLGGSGTFSGPATLNSGGTIAPGAGSPGVAGTTLHGSSTTWNGGSTLSLQISNGSIADALALSGALTKGTAGTFTIAISGTGVAGENYTLATFGSTTFSVANFTLQLPAHYAGTLVETATSLTLNLTSTTAPAVAHFAAFASPVSPADTSAATDSFTTTTLTTPVPTPEPGSAALLAFGACGVLGWRRRRR